jgi:hypothetical protein
VVKCSKCGFELPEGSAFCPNCGAPVEKARGTYKPEENVLNLIWLGILGTFLSIAISMVFSTVAGDVDLYFLPSFLSALAIIYLSRVKGLKDALIVAAVIYLLTDAVGYALFLGTLYAQGETLASFYLKYYRNAPTLADVLIYPISPVTAILSGYIGSKIAPRRVEEQHGYFRERFEPALSYITCIAKNPLKKLKYILLGFYKS